MVVCNCFAEFLVIDGQINQITQINFNPYYSPVSGSPGSCDPNFARGVIVLNASAVEPVASINEDVVSGRVMSAESVEVDSGRC